MDRYFVDLEIGTKGVATIIDMKPKKIFNSEVCTIYSATSALDPHEMTSILNKWDKLQNLPSRATKKQILEIINKK